ncbi:MAG TPA: tetratricopeptide repeat protein [Thermoanaerobaculia bacterium]
MKKRSMLAVAVLCATLHISGATLEPPKPSEKWITLTADEFQFISNASPAATLDIARDMLRMRAAVGQVTKLKVRSPLPTNVFIFASERGFSGYRDAVLQRRSENIVGVFANDPSGNFILMRSDTESVDRTVYHELTHYFVQNTTAGMPLWLNEGLAEYYSTFRTVGDAVHIGRPISEHVLWLRGQTLIPLPELFATTVDTRTYNEGIRQGVFYAESWALLHYLMNDADRRAKLIRFLTQLGTGKSVDDAFTAAFSMKYAQLEQELRSYVRHFSFPYLNFSLDEMSIPEPPKPEPMSRDEVLFQLGHLLAHVGPETAATAERFLQDALEENPDHAAAHADLGRLYDVAGRRADADAAYARAVRLGSNDPEVFLLAAYSLMERYRNQSPMSISRAEIARMRELFQRSTQLDPKRAAAWAGLGATYISSTEDLAPGIAALEKSLALAPGDDQPAFHLAQLYANSGRTEDATRLMHRLETSTTLDEESKANLRSMIAQLERSAIQEHLVDAMNDAIAKANAGEPAEALTLIDALMPSITEPEMLEYAKKFRDEVAMRIRKK